MKIHAEAFSHSGNHHKAVDLLEDAITTLEDAFEMEHYRVIEGKDTLGYVYMRLRRYQEAAELREQILNHCLKHYGSKNRRTLISRYNLALTYEALDRTQDGIRILTEAANTVRDTCGHDDPFTVECVKDLEKMQARYDKSMANEATEPSESPEPSSSNRWTLKKMVQRHRRS